MVPNIFLKLKHWSKRLTFTFSDQGLLSISNFIIRLMIIRFLTPEQYGIYTTSYSIMLFFLIFHNALIFEPINILGHSNFKHNFANYLKKNISIQFILTGVYSIVILLIGLILFLNHSKLSPSIFCISFCIHFVFFFLFLRACLYVMVKPEHSFIGNISYFFFNTIILYSIHKIGFISPPLAFISMGSTSLISSLLLWFLLFKNLKPSVGESLSIKKVFSENFSYGKWTAFAGMFGWASGNYYIFLISTLYGYSNTAGFGAMQLLIDPLYRIFGALTLLMLPWSSKRLAEKSKSLIKNTLFKLFIVYGSLALIYSFFILMLGEFITLYVFKKSHYKDFLHLLPYFAMLAFNNSFLQVLGIVLKSLKLPDRTFMGAAINSFLSISIGTVLVFHRGINGAAISMVICSYISLFVSFFYIVKVLIDKRN